MATFTSCVNNNMCCIRLVVNHSEISNSKYSCLMTLFLVKRRKKVSGEQTIIPKLCLIPTYVPYKGILLDWETSVLQETLHTLALYPETEDENPGFVIEQDQSQDECPYCFCKPCFTNEQTIYQYQVIKAVL
jgi:hypothetical protein